ncbi:unnamed protein product [Cladocopium goreaui]|uniref:J domain-containing protein n=1 Tax=Cladocopium goreaui TaxID=2562237 RepID=A0A9P1FV20_9DINO|nr:unnamed protein product [Cladocopium goreaui]
MSEPLDVVLPKKDFTYVAGKTDRPWEHFTGRWEAIKPILAEMLAASSKTRMAGFLSDPSLGPVSACENISGTLQAPAIYAMQDIGPTGPLPPEKSDVALALKAAPTARGPRNF